MSRSTQGEVGRERTREEDDALLRGLGRYVADLDATRVLAMKVVRSTIAHGRVRALDFRDALAVPGVVGIFGARDLLPGTSPLPIQLVEGAFIAQEAAMVLMASDTVRFVGEPIAVIVAEDARAAEDAAELVVVEIDPVQVVIDVEQSRSGSVLIHEGLPDNRVCHWHLASSKVDAVFREASHIVAKCFTLPRLAAGPIETRGCVASFDSNEDRYTLFASAQDPHRQRSQLAAVLNCDVKQIHVKVPQVGGAFGSKGFLIPEYAIAAILARRLSAPVRWIEDRTENMVAAHQGRGMGANLEIAIDASGRFLGLRGEISADLGAYLYPTTAVVPTTAAALLCGVYKIDEVDIRVSGYATNKVPTGPYRGAGRPEAAYFIESLIEEASREIGIEPIELRRRNLLSPEDFPYRSALGLTYDSGDYLPALNRAEELLEETRANLIVPPDFGERVVIGSSVAMYVERAGAGLWESGGIEIEPDGRVIVRSGSSSTGQGHQTSLSQIVADYLDVDFDRIELRQGDSDDGEGVGTFASRSMTLGGEALVVASREIIALAKEVLAQHLEASAQDLVYEGGELYVQGSPTGRFSLGQVAQYLQDESNRTLSVQTRARISGPVFPFGAYGAHVAIDLETGKTAALEIVGIDDGGTIINPLLAEGQVIGSTLQGVSSVLYEEIVYDPDGQPLTSNFADYAIPAATEVTYELVSEFRQTPTPYTELGAKGLGESGTIGALPALSNAINNALWTLGCQSLDPPFTPMKLWSTIRNVTTQRDSKDKGVEGRGN